MDHWRVRRVRERLLQELHSNLPLQRGQGGCPRFSRNTLGSTRSRTAGNELTALITQGVATSAMQWGSWRSWSWVGEGGGRRRERRELSLAHPLRPRVDTRAFRCCGVGSRCRSVSRNSFRWLTVLSEQGCQSPKTLHNLSDRIDSEKVLVSKVTEHGRGS